MQNATRFRFSLAVVTLAGAFHLESAQAAEPGRSGPCETWVDGYAAGYCAAQGGRPSSVTYSCNADGTVTIYEVKCFEEAH